MDYSESVKICELYEEELALLDQCSDDLNNDENFSQLQECHKQYTDLLKGYPLIKIYESVRGLDNPNTINLYFEEAEKLEDDYEQMIPLYMHVLEGCSSLYGETGEKTIECKLQIAICIRNLCEKRNDGQETNLDEKYTYKTVLAILENLFLQSHEHPIYGTFISTMLCDEYVRDGNKKRALETFEKWSSTHQIENICDEEELNAWLEYTFLLSELGWLETSIYNVEHICEWAKTNLPKYGDLFPYIKRRVSEIYVSCTLYQKAAEVLEDVIKYESFYPETCAEEFLNIKAQLAHCYNLNGNSVQAAVTAYALQDELNRLDKSHPSKYVFDNILSNIIGNLGDCFEQYTKLLEVYLKSKNTLGENNEETVLYENNLGKACFEMYYKTGDDEKGRYLSAAEYFLKDALEHSEFGRGKGNPFSLLIQRNLAEVQAEKGDVFTAINTLKDVWHKNAEIFSEDNPETADSKLRYAALCMEVQQAGLDTPEWLDEVDAEPLFAECFYIKNKFLGIRHSETIDALYWYARSVQSNELIYNLKSKSSERTFEKSLHLHRLLLSNIGDTIEQAFYINSIQKQNEFMDILENEFDLLFWLLTNSMELKIPIDIESFYELIAGYKNISYDMQCKKLFKADDKMRKKFAEVLSTDSGVLEYLYKNPDYEIKKVSENRPFVEQLSSIFQDMSGVFIDFWQETNIWHVFIIDKNGISYKNIDWLEGTQIPDINDEPFDQEPNLDDYAFTLEERLKWALFIAEHLSDSLKDYGKVYVNLHKQLQEFPVLPFIYMLTGIPCIMVSSIRQVLSLKKESRIREARIGFLEDSVSPDHLLVKELCPDTHSIQQISSNHNIICLSGHGFYEDNAKIPEGKRNYIKIEGNRRLYIQDIISNKLANVQLVILPVCQSGNGTIYQNFGNYSIGRAFRMAGAEYTIETIWDVPLSASLVFEYEFFRALQNTPLISMAFHNAVNCLKHYTCENLKQFCKRIRNLTGDHQLARVLYSENANGFYPFQAPVYWAGFCLQKGEL